VSLFGALAVLSPWWLAALIGLPVIYWLLRVTPPAPRRERFPAIRILQELQPKEETPAQTPLWLLILRLVLAAIVILALAHPLMNPPAQLGAAGGPLLLVIDDGWAAAHHWRQRQEAIGTLIDRAEREARPVIVLTTAASATGEAPRPSRLMRATEARTLVAAIEPKPWPNDRAAALAALAALPEVAQAAVVYLTDGLDDSGLTPLVERLQRLGGVTAYADVPGDLPRLLQPPVSDPAALIATALRPSGSGAAVGFLRGTTEDGRLLAREELRWADGQTAAQARLALPSEIRNRLTRLEIEGENSAGGVVLLDERWRRRPVGIASGTTSERAQPLLSDTYYVERAVQPYNEVHNGTLQDLLQRELATIILSDVGRLADADRQALENFMRRGGVVLRFAGPRMAEGSDALVPVQLRADGGRAFGGAMTWAQPLALAPFAGNSPFAGLTIPEDVRVTRQLLAEPGLDLSDHTWARLSDGTPLITADRRGDGWLVLVHTGATPEWSSIPISGLFVEMLQRIVALSQGVGGGGGDQPLPPVATLDGYGRLQAPPGSAQPVIASEIPQTRASARNPPGYYGTEAARRAVNLANGMQPPRAIGSLPAGTAAASFASERTLDLKPWLLAAALLLLLIDLAVSIVLRGFVPRLRPSVVVLGALLFGQSALAQAPQIQRLTPAPPGQQQQQQQSADPMVNAASTTRLAYVQTGIAEIDQTSRAGLTGLGQVLARRTAVDMGQPIGIDPAEDELAFYPLIYWPIVPEGARITPQAVQRVAQFLRAGGMILFDTRDAGAFTPGQQGANSPTALRLREVLRPLNLAALVPMPNEHVLTRSFYLLREFPGRWTGGTVWIEQIDDRVNDGVSSVIIGANDWAAAWAVDGQGRHLFPTVPGGEAQRELAIRFGVNVVMYALTGNYKADQVHIEAIMERLRR
jgi:hypothetical protein